MLEVGDPWAIGAIFVALVAIGIPVQRIDRRTKMINARLGRLSITFQKIENDLDALQSSLVYMSRAMGPETAEKVARTRNLRSVLLRHTVEIGPNSTEVLRGLEYPPVDEDPGFWKGNLADRMKLPESLLEVEGVGDEK